MRGKPLSLEWALAWRGITPADAGKTPETVMKWWLEKDHPRGCGENTRNLKASGKRKGSPPRMRGKPSSGALADAAGGITPADAGKTIENIKKEYTGVGSPPRMRGKRANAQKYAQ